MEGGADPGPEALRGGGRKGAVRGAAPLAAAMSHVKISAPPLASYFPFALCCADKRPRRPQRVLGGGCSRGVGGCSGLVCREGSLSIPPSPLRPPSLASRWLLGGSGISDACRKGWAELGCFGHHDPLRPCWIHREVLARVVAPSLQPDLLPGTSLGPPGTPPCVAGHGDLANHGRCLG